MTTRRIGRGPGQWFRAKIDPSSGRELARDARERVPGSKSETARKQGAGTEEKPAEGTGGGESGPDTGDSEAAGVPPQLGGEPSASGRSGL